MKHDPELEVYEVIKACYPDKFPETEGCDFELVLGWAEDVFGFENLHDLLERLTYMQPEITSSLTGTTYKVLGSFKEGNITALIKREA